MISLQNVQKSYGPCVVLEDVSLVIDRTDRIGMVGPNGAGKTTLLSLVMGHESPDGGQVQVAKGVTFGYLPQEIIPVTGRTVLEEALDVAVERDELTTRRTVLEEELAEADRLEAKAQAQLLRQYGDVQQKLDLIQAEELGPRAKRILVGLGFNEGDFERPLAEFSGGWVMRAAMARLLVSQPDFLLLDEPTNHLDLEALLWFQAYLEGYPGGLLVVSHDRDFLNGVATSIVELCQGRLTRYAGRYEDYLEQREARMEQVRAAQKNQQRKIAQVERFIERFRAKATKARQVQSRIKMLEKIDRIQLQDEGDSIHFRFPQPERSNRIVLELTGIKKSYDSKTVYRDLNLRLERGERVALVGPNGAGKSTLLKLMAGVLPFERGERRLGPTVRCAYYAQFRHEMLNLEHTVLAEAMTQGRSQSEVTVRTLLGAFLFHGDDVFKRVAVLSGGEKSRLALVKILLDPPNLLLLDEPTIHLDLDSVEALTHALTQFTGTLVMISHDVYFLRMVARKIIRIESGSLTVYPGDYDYYQWRRGRDHALPPEPIPTPSRTASQRIVRRDQKRQEAEERNRRYRQEKQLRDELAEIEDALQELLSQHDGLVARLQSPETYKTGENVSELNKRFAATRASIEELTRRWEELSLSLEELSIQDEPSPAKS